MIVSKCLILLAFVFVRGKSDYILNSFVDKYLNNLLEDGGTSDEFCIQHIPSKVFKDGDSSVRVMTSDASTGFICGSRRDGDVEVERFDESVILDIPLRVDKVLFDFDNIWIGVDESLRDLGRVEFSTSGRVRLKVGFEFESGTADCRTTIDAVVTELDRFKCLVRGERNQRFEKWINGNLKDKFKAYMKKQYGKFFDDINICDRIVRSMKNEVYENSSA